MLDEHDDLKALRRASQQLLRLTSIVYTDWQTLSGHYQLDMNGETLADLFKSSYIRQRWYIFKGPMSWDVDKACLPAAIMVGEPVRDICQLARAIYHHKSTGLTIKKLTFTIKDIDSSLLPFSRQMAPSKGIDFGLAFMTDLRKLKLSFFMLEYHLPLSQQPLLNRLSDLLASAKQLRSLTLEIHSNGHPLRSTDELLFSSRHHWPHLRNFNLSGFFRINASVFLNFLRRHAASIKNLRACDLYIARGQKKTWSDIAIEMQTILPKLDVLELYKCLDS